MEKFRERTWLFVALAALFITVYSTYKEGFTKNSVLYLFVLFAGTGMFLIRRNRRLKKLKK